MRRAFALALLAVAALSARGDDPAKPPQQPPPAQPAQPDKPRDPAQEQMFQDKAAEDALPFVLKPGVADVMAGLEALSKLRTGKVTKQVVDAVLARREMHVAEFAGHCLALCDPEGALAEMRERVTGQRPVSGRASLQAIGVLSELPADASAPLLASERLLHSKDDDVRREAIRALGWQRSPLAVDAAIFALSSKDRAMRNTACVALGRIGDKRAIPPLLGKLDDKEGTPGFAAIALGRIEDERIFGEVVARLGTGDRREKGKALVACARARHADRLVAMLAGGTPDSRIAVCAALAKIRDRRIDTQRALLDACLGDPDRWVRAAAFHAVGVCATPELAPHLAKRMGQPNVEKLRYVWELAGDVEAKECVGPIAEAMWTEKNDVLRRIAIDAFWRIKDAPSMQAAEDRIRKSEAKALERAAEILALRHNLNGFNLALEMLSKFKQGGREQFLIELALEHQTGHFFGPSVVQWKDWIAKNPKFFEKEQAAIEREKWREDFLKENKETAGPRTLTPATEEAVQMALDYLARHQEPDGAFDWQEFLHRCDGKQGCPVSAGARIDMDPVGVTGLCTLAYFGAGCSPTRGRYRGVLNRALEYMLSRQMPDGDYQPNDLVGGYNRAVALQTYAEAALTSNYADNEYQPFVQRGVDFLANIQSEKAGWRYRVVDNASDTSVVAWVLFAAKAAEKARARVRRSIYEGCDLVLAGFQVRPTEKDQREDFVLNLDPNYAFDVTANQPYYEYHTGYQDRAFQANQAPTALGLMSRILLGYRRSHPFCIGSANTILTKQLPALPKKQGDWDGFNMNYQYPMYFLYYGTLAMHQMGGKLFREWNKVVKEILPNTQEKKGCEAGSWASWGLDGAFSRLYTTAIGALTLETYYRYAPILQD